MAVEVVESTGSAATQVSAGQILAPEVSLLNFRYFDGMAWLESWDSDASGRVPRAVEIMIAFQPAKRKSPLFGNALSHSMDSFRTVILIPISDPYPPEFVQ